VVAWVLGLDFEKVYSVVSDDAALLGTQVRCTG
jgi:hypothetical protein